MLPMNQIWYEREHKMKTLCLLLIVGLVSPSFAGRCDHSWQRAKDGSICGKRAADQRPGGRF